MIGGLLGVRVLGLELLVDGRVWIGEERGWRRRGVCCRFREVGRGVIVMVWRRRLRWVVLMMNEVKSMRM